MIIDGPYGVFTAARLSSGKALLVAGGIGITPLRAILERLSASGTDSVLVFSNRSRKDMVFAGELAELEKKGGLRTVHVLSEDKDWAGEKGRVDAAMLRRLVPDLAERDAFLCGPPPMMAALDAGLRSLGIAGERIHYEKFSF